MCGLQDCGQRQSLQPRRFVNRDMIDACIARHVDIRQFAVEAGARLHIGVGALRDIEHAGDITWCGIGAGAVERDHQRDRHALEI